MKKYLQLKIYNITLLLSVSIDINKEIKKFKAFDISENKYEDEKDIILDGLVAVGENRLIGIFLLENNLTPNVISHEIFHAVHFIMQSIGEAFDIEHQEPHAYLCGYITEWVYKILAKENYEIQINPFRTSNPSRDWESV